MKKIILVLFLGLVACGDIPEEAQALQYGADVNRGECVANYVRTAPGVCTRNVSLSLVAGGVPNSACISHLVPELPSTAKTVSLLVSIQVNSVNAVGARSGNVSFYSDDPCASLSARVENVAYEWSAIASTQIGGGTHTVNNIALPVPQAFYHKEMAVSGFLAYSLNLLGYTD